MNNSKIVRNFLFSSILATTFISTGFATPNPAPSSKSTPSIAKEYLVAASFDPQALFAANGAKKISITLPQIGVIQIIHEKTGAVDGAGKVLRWAGHVSGRTDLQAVFVRGISGHVTGTLDTPKGRVLLGNANDHYFFHSEAPDSLPTTTAKLPTILLALQTLPASSTKQHTLKPDAKLITYPVEFNAAGLAGLAPGEDTLLSLPGTGDFVVTHDQTYAGDWGGSTFVGHLKDYGDDFRVLVTYTPAGAQGSILTPYGEYQLQTLGNGQWLLDVSRSKLEQHASDESDAAAPPAINGVAFAGGGIAAQGNIAASSTAPSGASTSTTGTSTAAGKTQIDVLVLYTPGMEKRFGGLDQTLARIQLLTALSNQAYQDSNVTISLRLVKAVKLDIPDTTANTQMLSDMLNGKGAFTGLAAMRKTYGADLVTLVRPFYLNEQGRNCGVAYVGGYGGSNIANYKDYGLSVVSDGKDMMGQSSYCNDYTFAHELGHNMGSMHDRQTVASQGGGSGAYPYAFGSGQAGSFGTIMSYISPKVGKFSSPNTTCSSSKLPCGVAASDSANAADNALSLNNTRLAVAAFMPSANNVALAVAGVVSTKGQALANVTINASSPEVACSKSGSNGVYSCSVPANWSGSLTPALSGYQFTPASHSFSKLSASVSQKNFEATAVISPPPPTVNTTPLTIAGVLASKGKPVANVPIYTTSANVSCGKSAANGSYTCRVPANWSGSVVPMINGYQFAPTGYSFNKMNSNAVGKNFAVSVAARR